MNPVRELDQKESYDFGLKIKNLMNMINLGQVIMSMIFTRILFLI